MYSFSYLRILLAAIMCNSLVAIHAQAPNPHFNPDYNGDGCITVDDFLAVLGVFDSCNEGHTMYYFHGNSAVIPFGGADWTNESVEFYYFANDEWIGSSDIGQVWAWLMDHNGEEVITPDGTFLTQGIDSITNVSVPLDQSIPNGSIVMPETAGAGAYFFVINDAVDFDFEATNVFYSPNSNCQAGTNLAARSFEWNGENWTIYRALGWLPTTMSETFNVLCGY